jgi:hypothetical protein
MRLRSAVIAAASLALASAPALAHGKPVHRAHHKTAAHKPAPKRHSEARGVAVVMDEVRLVTFERPVSTVFVGNPTIADATIIDPHHAFILGKTFGVTNLIALGPQSQTISNQQITVANRAGGVVTLNKGAAQYTYSCTYAHCETSPRPGDQKSYFEDTESSASSHEDQAIKAASASDGH